MNYSNTALTALFLQTSIQDAKTDYIRSVSTADFPHWDAVILTASNEQQAFGYQKQIEYRKSRNLLPASTEFIVVPDRGDKRVGSAGSTLSVIRLSLYSDMAYCLAEDSSLEQYYQETPESGAQKDIFEQKNTC